MPRSAYASPWARYEPAPDDPWDLRKVAHLHRRAGFGATRAELLRDIEAGPEAAVTQLFHPPQLPTEEVEAIDGLRQTARSSSNLDLLKVCWLNRILHGPDPLREKLTLFWHGHFATSNQKVEFRRAHGPAERDASNPRSRPHVAHSWKRSSPTRPCWSGSMAGRARKKSPTRTSPASFSSFSRSARAITPSTTSARPPARSPGGYVKPARGVSGNAGIYLR